VGKSNNPLYFNQIARNCRIEVTGVPDGAAPGNYRFIQSYFYGNAKRENYVI